VIRILLADDQVLIRSGIRSLLEAEDDIEVVAEAADGQQAVALAAEHRPDIALVDILKLGARDRAQLVVFAYQTGLVTPRAAGQTPGH